MSKRRFNENLETKAYKQLTLRYVARFVRNSTPPDTLLAMVLEPWVGFALESPLGGVNRKPGLAIVRRSDLTFTGKIDGGPIVEQVPDAAYLITPTVVQPRGRAGGGLDELYPRQVASLDEVSLAVLEKVLIRSNTEVQHRLPTITFVRLRVIKAEPAPSVSVASKVVLKQVVA
jgi:hypothetical protein